MPRRGWRGPGGALQTDLSMARAPGPRKTFVATADIWGCGWWEEATLPSETSPAFSRWGKGCGEAVNHHILGLGARLSMPLKLMLVPERLLLVQFPSAGKLI